MLVRCLLGARDALGPGEVPLSQCAQCPCVTVGRAHRWPSAQPGALEPLPPRQHESGNANRFPRIGGIRTGEALRYGLEHESPLIQVGKLRPREGLCVTQQLRGHSETRAGASDPPASGMPSFCCTGVDRSLNKAATMDQGRKMGGAVKGVCNMAERLVAQDLSSPVTSPFPWRMEID